MKKLLLPLTITGILLLGACSNDTENKAESEEKESESVEKKDKSSEQDTTNEQENNNNVDNTESDKNTDGLNHAKPIEEMTPEEYDTYLLTQKRSYLTKEQQKRYDELLEMKGSTPAENDEKNQAYNRKMKNKIEGNGGGTALIEPRREGETDEEHKKRQEKLVEQAKQREAERYGKEQLTEAEQNEIANKQAKEYRKANPEGEPSNKGKMGPGPEDPDYKPDPRFTEGAEGYDPVEGAKDPNKDDFTFK